MTFQPFSQPQQEGCHKIKLACHLNLTCGKYIFCALAIRAHAILAINVSHENNILSEPKSSPDKFILSFLSRGSDFAFTYHHDMDEH